MAVFVTTFVTAGSSEPRTNSAWLRAWPDCRPRRIAHATAADLFDFSISRASCGRRSLDGKFQELRLLVGSGKVIQRNGPQDIKVPNLQGNFGVIHSHPPVMFLPSRERIKARRMPNMQSRKPKNLR
jgi:hypothetical protein